MRRVAAGKKYSIDTDGRTVWVNAEMCLARLCPVSGEVTTPACPLDTVPKESFHEWKLRVEKHLDIKVPPSARPEWDKKKGARI